MRLSFVIVAALAGLLLASEARASECDRSDPAWLMCEDFEGGDAGWEAWFADSAWTECAGCPGSVNDPERIRLEDDAALAHDGDWSLHTPGGEGAGHQGGTLRYASCDGAPQSGCDLVGYDRLYFRTWVRLAAEHDYVHHFIGLGAPSRTRTGTPTATRDAARRAIAGRGPGSISTGITSCSSIRTFPT